MFPQPIHNNLKIFLRSIVLNGESLKIYGKTKFLEILNLYFLQTEHNLLNHKFLLQLNVYSNNSISLDLFFYIVVFIFKTSKVNIFIVFVNDN